MKPAILDTSVLIEDPSAEKGRKAAISTVSLAELYFGVLVATDPIERARRTRQLGFVESHFDALPLDERVAAVLGQLQAAVADRGGSPRRRTADLAIAATAIVHEALLFTRNYKDFKLIDDLVDVREPPA
ncbi:MAG TPA: PIN domain-containing protein [Solirubrobacterales bacterium]|nr:PIN domain-containing protein [Solirubrobacterales bacterium]